MDIFKTSMKSKSMRGNKIFYKVIDSDEGTSLEDEPVVILPGTFSSYDVLCSFIGTLSKTKKVVYVELPGMGSNTSTRVQNFVEQGSVLTKFLSSLGISRYSVLGLADSIPTAYFNAFENSKKVSNLFLYGATPRVRDSVRVLFSEIISMHGAKKYEEYMTGVYQALFNFSKRDQIMNYKNSLACLKGIVHQHLISSDNNLFHQLSQYLSLSDLPDGLSVPTLIMSGEFDPFTTVYDNVLVARRCLNSQVVTIEKTDHFAFIQAPENMCKLMNMFIEKSTIKPFLGVRLLGQSDMPINERQIFPRVDVNEIGFVSNNGGIEIPISIVDMNTYGCKLFTIFDKHKTFSSDKLKLKLSPKDGSANIELDLSIFSRNRGSFKGVFHFSNMAQSIKAEEFLRNVSEKRVFEEAA